MHWRMSLSLFSIALHWADLSVNNLILVPVSSATLPFFPFVNPDFTWSSFFLFLTFCFLCVLYITFCWSLLQQTSWHTALMLQHVSLKNRDILLEIHNFTPNSINNSLIASITQSVFISSIVSKMSFIAIFFQTRIQSRTTPLSVPLSSLLMQNHPLLAAPHPFSGTDFWRDWGGVSLDCPSCWICLILSS